RTDGGEHLRPVLAQLPRYRENVRVVDAVAAISALTHRADLKLVRNGRIGSVHVTGKIEVVRDRNGGSRAKRTDQLGIVAAVLASGSGAHRPVVIGDHVLEER